MKINKILVEGVHGHGAIKSKKDFRDHKLAGLGMASVPFDWNTGYDIEALIKTTIPPEDQNGSFSCGGQALRYLIEAHNALETKALTRYSAKDSYSRIFYPGGGTTIADIGKICINSGVAKEIAVPSYKNNIAPDEPFMEDKSISSIIGDSVRFSESAYARSNLDYDSLAQAIRDCNGIIIRINGQNNGTWLSPFPVAPNQTEWSHFLYAGKAKMINGKKAIGVLNSWGAQVGQNGWQWLIDYPIQESLVFYDKATYTYTPTNGQAMLSFIQRFVRFFTSFIH